MSGKKVLKSERLCYLGARLMQQSDRDQFYTSFSKKKKKIGTNWYQAFDLKLLYSCILKAVILDFESQSSLRRKKVV